jgi:hypothetical protein
MLAYDATARTRISSGLVATCFFDPREPAARRGVVRWPWMLSVIEPLLMKLPDRFGHFAGLTATPEMGAIPHDQRTTVFLIIVNLSARHKRSAVVAVMMPTSRHSLSAAPPGPAHRGSK